MSTMRRRDDKMNELKKEVLGRLASISADKKYPALVKFLITQGLMTLMETEVELRVRKEDLAIVSEQLPIAVQLYKDTMSAATSIVPTVTVTIDQKQFLPPGPKPGQQQASCCGGVLLSSRAGQIVCRNTLDARVDLCFESLKPQLRGALFGVREKILDHLPAKKHGVSLPK